MGQLEKYGLYVLVVVIVLILGVAIWGDGRPPQQDPLVAHGGAAADEAAGRGAGTPRDAYFGARREDGGAGGATTGGAAGAALPVLDLDSDPTLRPTEIVDDGRIPAVDVDPPATTAPSTYVVRRGDNPTKIVKRLGGTDADVPAFLAANPGLVATALKEGQVLNVPAFGAASAAAPALAGATPDAPRGGETPPAVADGLPDTYTVLPGETPGVISSKLYGTPTNWVKLLEHNGLTAADEKRLAPGRVLRVPKLPVARR